MKHLRQERQAGMSDRIEGGQEKPHGGLCHQSFFGRRLFQRDRVALRRKPGEGRPNDPLPHGPCSAQGPAWQEGIRHGDISRLRQERQYLWARLNANVCSSFDYFVFNDIFQLENLLVQADVAEDYTVDPILREACEPVARIYCDHIRIGDGR